MSSTRAQQTQLLSNSTFLAQVTGSLLAYANGVLSEGPGVANHNVRLAYANACFLNPAIQAGVIAPAMLLDSNIVSAAAGTPADSDVDSVVSTYFTNYAQFYAGQPVSLLQGPIQLASVSSGGANAAVASKKAAVSATGSVSTGLSGTAAVASKKAAVSATGKVFGLVQHASGSGTSQSLPSTHANNLIVFIVDTLGSGVTASDAVNGSYTLAANLSNGINTNLYVFYVANIAGGSVTPAAANTAGTTLTYAMEFSGPSRADGSSANSASGSTPTSGSFSGTGSPDLLVGYVNGQYATSAGSGFTTIDTVSGNTLEYLVSTAGVLAATWTAPAGTQYDAIAVAFK